MTSGGCSPPESVSSGFSALGCAGAERPIFSISLLNSSRRKISYSSGFTGRTKVKLVSTRMGQTTTKDMTPESFREAYGFAPIHIIDLKALMGDASDNIPGVKGVGEKTAMALVQRYETIDALYAAMPDFPGVTVHHDAGEVRKGQHRYKLRLSESLQQLFRLGLVRRQLDMDGIVRFLLAGYLLDATAGHYDIGRLFASWFREELQKPLYLDPDAFSKLWRALASTRKPAFSISAST